MRANLKAHARDILAVKDAQSLLCLVKCIGDREAREAVTAAIVHCGRAMKLMRDRACCPVKPEGDEK